MIEAAMLSITYLADDHPDSEALENATRLLTKAALHGDKTAAVLLEQVRSGQIPDTD